MAIPLCYINQAAPWKGRRGCTLKIEQCKNSLCKNKHQRKGFLRRAEMFSRQFLLRAGKQIKRSDFRVSQEALRYDLLRVWSWLRMNAGGVPNTCKSNEAYETEIRRRFIWLSGGRVSNVWATCLSEGDNSWKRLLIPHNVREGHPFCTKGAIRWKMGSYLIS